MSFIPKQNWPKYHSLIESKRIENERSRSAIETHRRYAEIVDHVRATKGAGEPVRSNAELQEKLALRAKLLVAWRLVKGPKRE